MVSIQIIKLDLYPRVFGIQSRFFFEILPRIAPLALQAINVC